MRYILLCAIIFSGCTFFELCDPGDTRLELRQSYSEYDNYKLPANLFLKVKYYTGKLNKIIKYEYDNKIHGHNYWSSPEETARNMYGDCEDIAVLEMVLHYMCYGMKGYIFLLTNGKDNHAVFVNYVYGRPYVYGEGEIRELHIYMKIKNYTRVYCKLNYSQALYSAFVLKTPHYYR